MAPPRAGRRSSSVTSWPSLASRAAEAIPPRPPPITTTRMGVTLLPGLRRNRGASIPVSNPPAPPSAAYQLGDQVEHEQAGDQKYAGDRRGDVGMLDRKPDHGENGDVLGDAGRDVGDRLGRGVDGQAAPGLHEVGGQRAGAADDSGDRLVE